MFRALAFLTVAVLLATVPVAAQDFDYCGDVNADGVINVSDAIYLIYSFVDGPAPEAGRGDVDFRAGINLGDVRYLIGYMFWAWPPGGCPPFDPYTIEINDADTVFLPPVEVPAGDGEFSLPVVLLSQNTISDLILPFSIETLGGTVTIDSVHLAESLPPTVYIRTVYSGNESGVVGFSGIAQGLDPGLHLLARVHCSYSSCPGGTVELSPITGPQNIETHYVYGPWGGSNDAQTIAYPTIATGEQLSFANMILDTDSLYFQALAEDSDPAAQTFMILSDGDAFSWTLDDGPAWIETDKTFGTSGETVSVTVHGAGLTPGTHYGEITVSADHALNAPQTVQVIFRLKAQYPSLDANCDGIFNITDVVAQIQYIFGDGIIPCDPCTGEPTE